MDADGDFHKKVHGYKDLVKQSRCPLCLKRYGVNSVSHFAIDKQHRIFYTVYSRELWVRRRQRLAIPAAELAEAERFIREEKYREYQPRIFFSQELKM